MAQIELELQATDISRMSTHARLSRARPSPSAPSRTYPSHARSLSAGEVLSRTVPVRGRVCTDPEHALWWEHKEEEARYGRGRARRRDFASLNAVDGGVRESDGRADDQGSVWAEILMANAY